MPEPAVHAQAIPAATECADCGTALGPRHGWCSLCREAYCLPCGRLHFCTSVCEQGGCLAGLCVRLVEGGALSPRWGLPPADG